MNLNDYFTQQQGSGQTDLASYLAALQQANYNANPNVNTNSNSDSIADYLSANGGDIQGSYGNSSMMGGATGDKDEDMLSSAVGIDQGMGGMPPSSMEQGEQPSDTLEGGAVGDNLGTQQQSNSSLPGNLAGYAQQLNNYAGGKPIDYNQVIAARMPQQYSPQNYGDMSPTDQKQYLNYFAQNMAHAANTPIRGVAHASPIPGIVEGAGNADNQMAALYNTRQTGIQNALTGATGLAENVAKNQIYQKRLDYDIARAEAAEARADQEYGIVLKDANGNPIGMVDRRNPSAPPTMFSGIPTIDKQLKTPTPSAAANIKVLRGIDAALNTDASDSDHLPLDETQKRQILKKANQMYAAGEEKTPDDAVTSILDELGGEKALKVTQVPGAIFGNKWMSNGKSRYFPALGEYLKGDAQSSQPAAVRKDLSSSGQPDISPDYDEGTPTTSMPTSYQGKAVINTTADKPYIDPVTSSPISHADAQVLLERAKKDPRVTEQDLNDLKRMMGMGM